MSHQRRMFENRAVYFVGSRIGSGLPFVPNDYINQILYGLMARVSEVCPEIEINAWLFMGHHYHGIVTIKGSPERLRYFLAYLNGEIGKVLAKLLGTRNRRFWAGQPLVARLLTVETVINKFAYIFLNPVYAAQV